jgi:hypothetical protein
MHVDRVTATIRFSQNTGRGAWKSLELGAEAQVAPNENWHTTQQELYHQLAERMRGLWANGNGKTDHQQLPTPESPPAARPHWCQQHQTEYNRFEKGGKTWFSHRTKEGSWCREPG